MFFILQITELNAGVENVKAEQKRSINKITYCRQKYFSSNVYSDNMEWYFYLKQIYISNRYLGFYANESKKEETSIQTVWFVNKSIQFVFLRLDQELDFIMAQQQELEEMLKPLEEAVSASNSGSRQLQQADKERDFT